MGENDLNPPIQIDTQSHESLKNKSKSRQKKRMYICTLNTRTLRTEESLQELELAISNLKWDIIGISEMRREGEKIEERKDYVMYHKGENTGHRGIGFLVNIKHKKRITDFEGISDRIAILHMDLPSFKKNWSIIQVYAPTEQANKEDLEHFYDTLSEVIQKY